MRRISVMKKSILTILVFGLLVTTAWAGGWDKDKGLNEMTLSGELVCVGCSLKKLDGANAQCSIYAQHLIGFKAGDGTLWSIVDNEKGHDITRSHTLVNNKKATITGYMFPLAHFIEIVDIEVDGVTKAQIQEDGWQEDQLMAKRLGSRKVGQAPQMGHEH